MRRPLRLLLAAVLVGSFNLRAGTASVGPVLRDLQASLAMSDSVAGLLVALPPLAFGVVGLLSGPLSRRFDAERLLLAFSLLLAAGLAVRALTGSLAVFMLASLGAIIGISVMNIMIPVLIRRWFPDRVGRLSGTYSMVLTYGAFFGAALTVPFGRLIGGWRGGLGLWIVPAVIGPLLLIAARQARSQDVPSPGESAAASTIGTRRSSVIRAELYRNPKAWALAVFLGLQALEAFSILGWFAAILRDDGIDAARAGWLLSVIMLISAPISTLLPRLTTRFPDQRAIIVPLVLSSALAYALMLVSPSRFALPAMLLLGAGTSTFSLALVLVGLRATTAQGTAELASMVQGVGFLLAGAGPILFGLLHDVTGAWQVPLWSLLVLLIPKMYVGIVVGRPGPIVVDDAPEAPVSLDTHDTHGMPPRPAI